MKSSTFSAWTAAIVILCGLACTDPTFVGAELLEQDQAEVAFTDTLSVSAVTVLGDTIRTYSPNLSRSDYYFGDSNDPIFGRTIASLYTQPRLFIDANGDVIVPDFSNSTVDSVVLVLPLSETTNYGSIDNQVFGFEVLALTEKIITSQIYYSDASLATGDVIGSIQRKPDFDSTFVTKLILPSNDTAVIRPNLRIPLSSSFANQLIALDTIALETDSSWFNFLPGILIKPTVSTPGLLNLPMNNTWAGIYVYYTKNGEQEEYLFPLRSSSPRISSYEQIHTGAFVEPFIGSATLGDSLLFLQGFEGLLAEISIPSLNQLNGYAVNRAILEFTAEVLSVNDTIDYPLPEQLVLFKKNATSGAFEIIQDIEVSSDLVFHGGKLFKTNGAPRYNLNITFHLQDMIAGIEPDKLYLTIAPRGGTPNRVVLRGNKRAESPVRLKLALTALQ